MNKTFKLQVRPANNRGFNRADFQDFNGDDCSIQESSLQSLEGDEVSGPCLWLGMNKGTHHHLTGDCLARMHLTQEMAREIAVKLLYFAKTGKLK